MLFLKKENKRICLQEIDDELPNLLQRAKIKISQSSEKQLSQIIQNNVRFSYFASPIEQTFKDFGTALFFPASLLYMVAGPYAVSIDPKCGNEELTNLSKDKIKLLDLLVYDEVLSRHLDHEKEAELTAKSKDIKTEETETNNSNETVKKDEAQDEQSVKIKLR